MKTFYVIVIIAVIAFVGAAIGYNINQPENLQDSFLGSASHVAVDLIGTKTGTTTVGVNFSVTATGGNTATTTYPTYIGSDTDTVIYTVGIKNASSTANLHFSFLGSNDYSCNTASTTTSYANIVLTKDVNWFDIGDNLKGKVHSTSLSSATTTLGWINPLVGQGREIVLTDLNYECVALRVSGSSTEAWVQINN